MMNNRWLSAVAVCLLFQGVAGADLSDGLVGYFPFDDGEGTVLNEQSGNAEDAELFEFDFEESSNWAEGQIGGALEFDGFDDYVIAPEFPMATDALSISIWGYANNADNAWSTLVKNWGGGNVGQFHFGLGEGGADTLNVFVTQADGAAFNAGTDPDEIEFESWEHYAFVADPESEIVTLFRNGEVVDERGYDGTFTPTPNSESLGIGVKTNDAGDEADPGAPGFWNGRLDDLGIWHRALTVEEVAGIYEAGLAGQPLIGGGVDGDFDGNGTLDANDMDLLSAEVRTPTGGLRFDVNGDGAVNNQDRFQWVEGLVGSYIGDSNLDGEFNSSDFVAVFTAGQYDDDVAGNSTWATGDWNGDTEFDSSDFVAAFTAGGFEVGPRAATQAVPEPVGAMSLLVALGGLMVASRRGHGSF